MSTTERKLWIKSFGNFFQDQKRLVLWAIYDNFPEKVAKNGSELEKLFLRFRQTKDIEKHTGNNTLSSITKSGFKKLLDEAQVKSHTLFTVAVP